MLLKRKDEEREGKEERRETKKTRCLSFVEREGRKEMAREGKYRIEREEENRGYVFLLLVSLA